MKLFTSPHKRTRTLTAENDGLTSPKKKATPSKLVLTDISNTPPSSPVQTSGSPIKKMASKLGAKVRKPFTVSTPRSMEQKKDDDFVVISLKEEDAEEKADLAAMDQLITNSEDSSYAYEAVDFDQLARNRQPADNTDNGESVTDTTSCAATPRTLSNELEFEMVNLKIDEITGEEVYVRRVLSRKAGSEEKNDAAVHGDLSTLGDAFKSALFNDTIFSDVLFRCGPKLSTSFLAHRVILAHRSEYFKSILSNAETTSYRKDNLNLRYVIDKPQYNPDIFSRVLEYIYTGSIELRCDNVLEVLQLSDDFRLNCLKKLCTKYIIQNTDADNVCNVLQLSRRFHAPELTRAALVFVEKRENVLEVLRSDGVCELNVRNLVDLVKRDNLPLSADEEIEIFDAVVRWNKHKTECKEKGMPVEEYNLEDIMKYIRFPLMNTEQLADVVEISGLVSQNLLFEAYRFHVIPLNKLSQNKKLKAEKNMDEDSSLEKKDRELKSKRFSTRVPQPSTSHSDASSL